MKCSKCKATIQEGASFCPSCGVNLNGSEITTSGKKITAPAGSDITINVFDKNADLNTAKARKIGCFSFLGIIVFVALLFSLITGNSSSRTASETQAPSTTGSYCGILMKTLNESVEYMGNAGSKYTLADVSAVLEDNGRSLTQGYDLEMAGSAERLSWIRNAGNQLLKIRVIINDGGDIDPPVASFTESFSLISETCK
jgi:hypothetical protein